MLSARNLRIYPLWVALSLSLTLLMCLWCQPVIAVRPELSLAASVASARSLLQSGQRPVLSATSSSSSYSFSFSDHSVFENATLSASRFDNPGTPEPVGNIDIGFTFRFYGIDYTILRISYTGNVQFGGPASFGNCLPQIPSASTVVPAIGVFANSLSLMPPQYYGPSIIGFATLGTAPNRRFLVRNAHLRYDNGQDGVGDLNFDVVLYETANVIEMRYFTLTPVPSNIEGDKAHTLSVGMQYGSDWISVLSASSVDPSLWLENRTLTFTPAIIASSSSTGAPFSSSLSFSSSSVSSSSTPSSSGSFSISSDSKLSSGSIAAIVCSIGGVIIVSLVLWYFWRCRKQAATKHVQMRDMELSQQLSRARQESQGGGSTYRSA